MEEYDLVQTKINGKERDRKSLSRNMNLIVVNTCYSITPVKQINATLRSVSFI